MFFECEIWATHNDKQQIEEKFVIFILPILLTNQVDNKKPCKKKSKIYCKFDYYEHNVSKLAWFWVKNRIRFQHNSQFNLSKAFLTNCTGRF